MKALARRVDSQDQWATFTADVLKRNNVDFQLPKP